MGDSALTVLGTPRAEVCPFQRPALSLSGPLVSNGLARSCEQYRLFERLNLPRLDPGLSSSYETTVPMMFATITALTLQIPAMAHVYLLACIVGI